MVTTTDVVTGLALLAGGVLVVLGYVSYREWDEPGSTMFGVFLAGWGGLPFLDALGNAVLGSVGFSGFLWIFIVVPWCLFALQYTGRAFTRRTAAALLLPALGMFPWFLSTTVGVGVTAFEVLGIFLFAYYSAVAIVGSLIVLRAAGKYGHLSIRQAVWLAVVGVLPPITMNSFGILIERLSESALFGIYAAGYTASALIAVLVLFRYDVFDSTPAAGTIGEQAVAQETDDLILIADDDGELIMRNQTVDRRLPTTAQGELGDPIERWLGTELDALRARETVELQTDAGSRQFDSQVTALTDQHDRQIGTMVSLRDVTDREIRQQRLEVLNRIVRHNLRNQASVIKANTEAVADELDDEQLRSYLDSATASVDELTTLGEKAKTIEDLLGRDSQARRVTELDAFLDTIATESTDQWPAARISTDGVAPVSITVDRSILRFILSNLVENAIEHADSDSPSVELRTIVDQTDKYPVTIDVSDDGPGIPNREIEVIEAGTETPMKHGSGVGLWVTNWAVRELGGELSFPDRDSPGGTVHVKLPHAVESGSSQPDSS